jgi:hypothetical protein
LPCLYAGRCEGADLLRQRRAEEREQQEKEEMAEMEEEQSAEACEGSGGGAEAGGEMGVGVGGGAGRRAPPPPPHDLLDNYLAYSSAEDEEVESMVLAGGEECELPCSCLSGLWA